MKTYLCCLSVVVALLSSSVGFAAVKYVKSDGSAVTEVAAGDVKNVCKKDFVYRDVNKDDVDPYLQNEIVKAALTGSLVSDMKAAIDKIKGSPGRCTWVTPDEFGKW